MDEGLLRILDALPEKPPRSRLTPYAEFIEELRRRGRTYRDIALILAERFQIRVWASTVQRFIHVQTAAKRRRGKPRHVAVPQPSRKLMGANVPDDEIRKRIEALKRRQAPTETSSERFHYDPSEPLHLSRKREDDKS